MDYMQYIKSTYIATQASISIEIASLPGSFSCVHSCSTDQLLRTLTKEFAVLAVILHSSNTHTDHMPMTQLLHCLLVHTTTRLQHSMHTCTNDDYHVVATGAEIKDLQYSDSCSACTWLLV